ncbi:sperm surface protein Sp17-like isoform X1 [Prorops nasuta]|uniref:sperm surface protein Sp17-like isoform X1 n=1 Tax=Prorops nasuta TaxID=863751 RepID=UPI0034CE426A
MGCNTSKESVQPAAEEAKEDVKNGDIPKSDESPEEGSKNCKEGKEESESLEKEKEEEAATRIQAAFRGHHARKSMKETESSKKTETPSEPEPTKEQLEEEFREDDTELCNAAVKIQASFRGHMSRKEQAAKVENLDEDAGKLDDKGELEGIDLTDPELNKAATKIQASFRGHKVRQEVVPTPTGNEPKK